MSAHFQREISKLKQQVLSLCTMVEGQLERAVRAIQLRDDELAAEVERLDEEIDLREIEVEEECLKTLALYQPVAVDLRFVVSTLKINNDLERIGDLAVNIARKVHGLANDPPPELACDLGLMCEKTQAFLRDAIDSLVSMNAAEAAAICTRDDEIDEMKAAIRREIESELRQRPDKVGSLLRLLAVSRNLERIADLATNIAEDVVYLVEGRIMRHPTLTAVRNGG
jgi:phosphate transport system protein